MFDATRPSHAPADHPKVKMGRVGILLANLGTPDDYSYWPMRRYLNEFLSDQRVIDYPKWKWQPILQGHHPDQAPLQLGRGLQVDLEPRQRRKPADDDHQGPDRQDARCDAGALW